MLGQLNPDHKEATVIGAGISGLLTAYALTQQGYEVTLLEASDSVGGLIKTQETSFGISEAAAHSILVNETGARFFSELGIEMVPVHPSSRARFIVREGRFRKFPLNLKEIWVALKRALFHKSRRGETLAEWGMNHLGPAAVDYLLTPFVRGIYGALPSELLVEAAFPSLVIPPGRTLLGTMLWKKRKGPRSMMMVPRGGMESVVSELERILLSRLGPRFKKGQRVHHLPHTPNLIVTVPARSAAELFEAVDPQLSAALSRVRYTPLISVTAFYERKHVPASVRGVGVLVPEVEGRECLGILFNSSSFQGRVKDESAYCSFTMMLGGSTRPDLLLRSDSELRSLVEREFAALLGIDAPSTHLVIQRQPAAVPQYNRDLLEVWKIARSGWCARPGKILFGNYTGQLSIRGMIEAVNLAIGLHPSRPDGQATPSATALPI